MSTVMQTNKMRFVALTIAIIMIAIAVWYRFGNHQSAPVPTTGTDTSATSTPTAYTTDTDGDGVPDWEEQLFGTNPNDPSSVPTTTAMTSISGNASTSVTTALAHVLLQQYLANTGGGSTSLSDPAGLSSAIANSVEIPTPIYHITKVTDIKTVANTQANRDAYQKALSDALAPMNHPGDAEITLYTRAIGGDTAAQTQLQAIVDTYATAESAAAKISVPAEAALMHVNALNALSYYNATLQSLLTHTDDPVGSLVLLRAYNDAEQNVFASFTAIQTYIATHKTAS